MEPPVEFNEKDFRDEVAKLYKSIKLLSVDEIRQNVVRGQYTSSIRGGEQIKGYREESGGIHLPLLRRLSCYETWYL